MSVKISDLPPTQFPLDGTELIEIVQAGLSKRATAAQFQAAAAYAAAFVVVAPSALLPNERVLEVSPSLTLTDAGPDTTITIDIADGGVTTDKILGGAVTNIKLADMDESTIKGRAAVSGTGVPVDLTPAEVYTILGLPSDPLNIALLDRQDQIFTGRNQFNAPSNAANGGALNLVSTSPLVRFNDTGGGADEKNWGWQASGGSIRLVTMTDASPGSAVELPIIVQRGVGVLVDEIELNATLLDFNANADVSGTLTINDLTTISSVTPILRLSETDTGAQWQHRLNGSVWGLRRTDGGDADAILVTGDGAGVITEIELSATLLDFNGQLDADRVGVQAAADLSSFNASGVAVRIGVANALLSAGTDVFVGRPSAIAGFTNGDLILQSFAATVNIVTGAALVAEFSAAEIQLDATLLDFNGSLDVSVDITAPLIRLTSTTDASLVSTGQAFQIGPSSGQNLIMDSNEIISRNNGAVSILAIQFEGGDVSFGGGTDLAAFDVNADLATFAGGQVVVPIASAAAPALVFSGALDMGLYRDSSTTMGIATEGAQRLRINSNGILIDSGTCRIREQAAAGADTGGVGQVWVLNDTPNLLYFTDDAGNDFPLQHCLQNIQQGNYTFTQADVGNYVTKTSGGAGETYTIPANATTNLPVGTCIAIDNRGGGALSIAITSDTLIWPAGGGATGTRTLGDDGLAVIFKVGTTTWMIAGDPLT